jgi:cell division protein ZapA (FtsZ GTPase activity inhibitor)
MRRIRVDFAGKEYSLLTDENEEIVDTVREKLKEILEDLQKYVGEHSLDEILFLALANSVLERIKLEKRIEELLEKIKEWSNESGNV